MNRRNFLKTSLSTGLALLVGDSLAKSFVPELDYKTDKYQVIITTDQIGAKIDAPDAKVLIKEGVRLDAIWIKAKEIVVEENVTIMYSTILQQKPMRFINDGQGCHVQYCYFQTVEPSPYNLVPYAITSNA